MQSTFLSCERLNITGTNASLSDVSLQGIWVSSASATPTIKVADAQGTIANTFTPTGATWYPLPIRCVGTVTVTISGTVDCTLAYVR